MTNSDASTGIGSPLAGHFQTPDGYRHHYRHYPASGPPRGIVVGIHGIQSHGGWYGASCSALAQAGWETYFLDRRGSGRNEVARGDCQGFRQLRDDIGAFLRFVRSQAPGMPAALMAISWGGKLALLVLAAQPALVDAVAFLCPGWFAKIDLSLREKLRIAKAYFWRSRRPIDIPLSDPALFTATPSWQQFLRQDPLSLRQGTARLLVTSRLLDGVIAPLPQRVACPALLMLAGQDRIIDNARCRDYFTRFAGPTTRLEYPEAHHTLEFEPDPAPIFADLAAWLERTVPAPGYNGPRNDQ